MAISIDRIFRYPVKGLSAEALDAVALEPGRGLPQDRRFAISHGAWSGEPGWRPRSQFATLDRHERLAALATRFDAETGHLEVARNGRRVLRAQVTTPTGRMLLDQFLAAYLKADRPGMPHVVEAPGTSFGDTEEPLVSILNLASVRDLEQRVVGAPVDPMRLRANLLVEGLAPWEETRWIGRRIRAGEAVLEVVAPIARGEAANVDPATGQRDLNLPLALRRGYGREDCGVHARVVEGGRVARGDALMPLD
jgi:uncharacterized protein YcbX